MRPGMPTDNGFVENFGGKQRKECLKQNIYWFAERSPSSHQGAGIAASAPLALSGDNDRRRARGQQRENLPEASNLSLVSCRDEHRARRWMKLSEPASRSRFSRAPRTAQPCKHLRWTCRKISLFCQNCYGPFGSCNVARGLEKNAIRLILCFLFLSPQIHGQQDTREQGLTGCGVKKGTTSYLHSKTEPLLHHFDRKRGSGNPEPTGRFLYSLNQISKRRFCLSLKLPHKMRMKSINVQIPKPPRVNIIRMPVAIFST